jgi:molybdate-binding protein/DNA-binding XRE family transcriptional regulator
MAKIMAEHPEPNRVAEARRLRGWSQGELARRVGVSRAGIGAIETGRVVPSVATALRLAAALGSSVEALFGDSSPRWAGPAAGEGERVWVAGDRLLRVEPTACGEIAHDARIAGGRLERRAEPVPTLVVAGCDPAVGLLGEALARRGVRLVALQRPSLAALEAVAAGVADVAGVHVAGPGGTAATARRVVGPGHLLVHLTRWREGVVVAGPRPAGVGTLVRGRTSWVAREPGSGARVLLERLFRQEGRVPRFRRVARDHRSVAQLVRDGWATAGVCVELVGREAGLTVVGARTESYDLCLAAGREDEPAVAALLGVLRDRRFRTTLGDLPGYDPTDMGEVRALA